MSVRKPGPWTGTSAICESGHIVQFRVQSPEHEKQAPRFCAECGGAVGVVA